MQNRYGCIFYANERRSYENGQLKPEYNLQISTHNQFIVHYSLHPNPNDTKTLSEHIKSFKEQYQKLPKELIADAGYGSQENYTMLEEQEIQAYVKYNHFDKDTKTGVPSTSLSNPEVAQLRTKAYNLLITDRGKELRKQRCHDVETVFAQIKNKKVLEDTIYVVKPKLKLRRLYLLWLTISKNAQ